MNRWLIVIGLFILIVIAAIALVLVPGPHSAQPPITPPISFAECARYFPVTQSYPRTCTTNLGQTFTEDIGNAIAMQDSIVVDSPKPNDAVSSPVSISGKARGTYFFEGTFPIEVHDSSGAVIGQGQGEAQQPWTSPDFVTFKATITFTRPQFGSSGTLVLKNDNPSGDPARQKELDIPVKF